jgi:hypothetical protein
MSQSSLPPSVVSSSPPIANSAILGVQFDSLEGMKARAKLEFRIAAIGQAGAGALANTQIGEVYLPLQNASIVRPLLITTIAADSLRVGAEASIEKEAHQSEAQASLGKFVQLIISFALSFGILLVSTYESFVGDSHFWVPIALGSFGVLGSSFIYIVHLIKKRLTFVESAPERPHGR